MRATTVPATIPMDGLGFYYHGLGNFYSSAAAQLLSDGCIETWLRLDGKRWAPTESGFGNYILLANQAEYLGVGAKLQAYPEFLLVCAEPDIGERAPLEAMSITFPHDQSITGMAERVGRHLQLTALQASYRYMWGGLDHLPVISSCEWVKIDITHEEMARRLATCFVTQAANCIGVGSWNAPYISLNQSVFTATNAGLHGWKLFKQHSEDKHALTYVMVPAWPYDSPELYMVVCSFRVLDYGAATAAYELAALMAANNMLDKKQ